MELEIQGQKPGEEAAELDDARLGEVSGGNWKKYVNPPCPKCGSNANVETYQPEPFKMYCRTCHIAYDRA